MLDAVTVPDGSLVVAYITIGVVRRRHDRSALRGRNTSRAASSPTVVKWSTGVIADEPAALVTTMSTTPAAAAGEVVVIVVPFFDR